MNTGYLIQTAPVVALRDSSPRSARPWRDLGRSKTIALAVARALRAEAEGSVAVRVVLTPAQLADAQESGDAVVSDLGEAFDRYLTMRLDVV